jgi:hypothetical protein
MGNVIVGKDPCVVPKGTKIPFSELHRGPSLLFVYFDQRKIILQQALAFLHMNIEK